MANGKDREKFGAGGHYTLRIEDAGEKARMIIEGLFFECASGELPPEDAYFDASRPPVLLRDYEEVYDWLADSRGQGLVINGASGTGKTMFARTVIPAMIRAEYGRVVTYCTARELNDRAAEALDRRLLAIDDIGTEDAIASDFGTRRMLFPQIVDNASQKGGLLIVTSNLTQDEMRRKYGFRTVDRLTRMARFATFTGESLRRCPTWDELPEQAVSLWNERGRLHAERKRRRAEQGRDSREAYSERLRRWYAEQAGECGMAAEDWLEWKTRDLAYLKSLWEKDRAQGRSAFFEWWLRAKNLWREDFADNEEFQYTAVKAIVTHQISTNGARAV